MARVTARMAYNKARLKRHGKQLSTRADQIVPDSRVHSRFTGLAVRPDNQQAPNFDSIASSTLDRSHQVTSPLNRSRRTIGRRNGGSVNGKKITDYFQIIKKGQEGLLKSPKETVSDKLPVNMAPNNLRSPTESPQVHQARVNRSSSTCQVLDVITISDSEDDEVHTNDKPSSQSEQVLCFDLKTKLKVECDNEMTVFKHQFVTSELTADEEIEILEMLPPIPLRDHPVFDVED